MNRKVDELIRMFPSRIPDITVDQFAEQHRTLPQGTPYPGKWKNFRTPYSVEIMRELSVISPTNEVIWLKASQVGATAIVENFIAYIIKMVPGAILYCTSKEELLKKWVNKRLGPLLISCKISDKIAAQHVMQGQRRSGNTQFSKEFPGGTLDMVSAQSEDNLRQDSVRYLILDEAAAYPWNISGFGDPIKIARARTANYRSRKKIFIPSTPGMESECRMWGLFEEGDRRRYHIPCPHCAGLVVLKLPSEPEDFYLDVPFTPMLWDTQGGELQEKTIHFDCPHCKESVFENKKWDMIQSGQWIPTAQSSRPNKKSYQIGRLYSLMDDWERVIRDEIDAESDPLALQAHHNHNCGIPYRETTSKPAVDKIYELRGNYKTGTVPNGVLYLTCAVDVQIGSESDKKKPQRLEIEVCGHGIGYRTWSILYKVIEGSLWDHTDGAWLDFSDFVQHGGFSFKRSDGFLFTPVLTCIDAREGKTTDVVFDFARGWDNIYPVMGATDLKTSKTGKKMSELLDEQRKGDVDKFRLNKRGVDPYLVMSSNIYKRMLYRRLGIRRQEGLIQRANFCDFPSDYPDKYFDMLVAEELRTDGTFWKPANRSNEALDLRVINMVAGEFWLAMEVDAARKHAMKFNKWSKEQAEHIHTRHILEKYQKNTARVRNTG